MVETGSAHGLSCSICGDPCASPSLHLATARNTTTLLTPDSPCKNYAEVNKWGRRWRVIEAFTGMSVKFYVDDMGDEADFKNVSEFAVPSMGDDPHEWNSFGACMEIALYKHDERRGTFRNRRVPPATAQAWAEELENQNEYVASWRKGKSTFGVGGHIQRAKDWVR